MKVTLYKAADDFRHLLDDMDPETGELPEGYTQARALVASKAQSVAAYVLSQDAEADMVEAHAKALLVKVKAARRNGEWLRKYLQDHMTACGITEIKSDDGTFKASLAIGRDESVDVFDTTQVPIEYMRETVKREPDKKLIGKAINDGYEVPGARLVKNDRLTLK